MNQSMREYLAISSLGKRKAMLTDLKNKLSRCELSDDPIIKKAVAIIESRRKQLDNINPIEE